MGPDLPPGDRQEFLDEMRESLGETQSTSDETQKSEDETLTLEPPIARLNIDILKVILEILSPQAGRLMRPDYRASLSVESFSRRTPQSVYDPSQISDFRLVCKAWSEAGKLFQFARISVRFSSEGFWMLRNIAEWPHIAERVKKFSFMIPRFYRQDWTQFEELLKDFNEPFQSALINRAMRKAEDQRRIIKHNIDKDSLLYALPRFTNLEQVRLMRVQDQVDAGWISFLNRYSNYAEAFGPEEWAKSCEYAASTLSEALKSSYPQTLTRFSSRFMEFTFPLVIEESLRTTISQLAPCLRFLDLEFVDDRSHQRERVLELSDLFKTVFEAANKLEFLHVGFRRRMSESLRLIFHDVRFRHLKHLGLHMWHVSDSDELIELLQRHQTTLQSIRLRYISLKQDSEEKNWQKVLRFIRTEIRRLSWVSLRGISYQETTIATTHNIGGLHFAGPALQLPLQMDSDDTWSSDEESDDDVNEDVENDHESSDAGSASDHHDTVEAGGSNIETEDDDDDDDDEEEEGEDEDEEGDEDEDEGEDEDDNDNDNDNDIDGDDENDRDTDLEEENHDLPLGYCYSTTNKSSITHKIGHAEPRHRSMLQCECERYGWDSLNDNGMSVVEEQWREWAIWVIKPCPRHDLPDDTFT